MENNFAQLEEKVLKAVSLIQDLRVENTRLQERASELENRYAELQEERDRIDRQLEAARQDTAAVENFEEKRREIEEKVGGLLEKLDQIG